MSSKRGHRVTRSHNTCRLVLRRSLRVLNVVHWMLSRISLHVNSLTHDIICYYYCAVWVPWECPFEVSHQSCRFAGIVLVFHLNQLNMDHWWENNFSCLNPIHKIDNWDDSFQFKFQTRVWVFNLSKFPKVTFFSPQFSKALLILFSILQTLFPLPPLVIFTTVSSSLWQFLLHCGHRDHSACITSFLAWIWGRFFVPFISYCSVVD